MAKVCLSSDVQIELRYLHISTKVLYPLVIKEGTANELMSFLRHIARFTPLQVLQMLDYSEEDISAINKVYDVSREISVTRDDVGGFVNLMLEGQRKKQLVERCHSKRELFYRYLLQERFCSNDESVALIDLGWRLSSQLVLRQVLSTSPLFYYFGVSGGRAGIIDVGSFCSFSYWEDFRHIYPNNKFIEFYMCRNLEGSTVGYKECNGHVKAAMACIL